MRKKQFGKLLTVSMSERLYGFVKELSDDQLISMGEVVRNAIEISIVYMTDFKTAESKPLTAQETKGYYDFSNIDFDEKPLEKEAQKPNAE